MAFRFVLHIINWSDNMKKIIAASFASALCFLFLASLQLPSFAQETQAPAFNPAYSYSSTCRKT
ncbi:hypothetical protein NIES4071_52630 [Calothrix sp. NIES-4071]|nr:hypothetical protein NIES4071_52630 [Calothrix sp. NIES-4071]BAZ59571.1 hypothetical protein NIES4105_52580 [Calothrix sp. NIES-4105]